MMWFLYALGCAVSETAKDLIGKRSFQVLDEYVVAWSAAAFSLPWVALICIYTGFAPVDYVFLLVAPLAAGLHVFAQVCYFRALRAANLSLVLPLVSFTPMFYLVTSPIMIGEYPNSMGVIGVILIVSGSYLLNLEAKAGGFLKPFSLLLQSKGARSMLTTAFIWSITGNIDKIGIAHSSMFTWFFTVITLMAIGLGILMLKNSKLPLAQVTNEYKSLLAIGFFHATSSICYLFGISLTLVAYIVSVKRLSVVMGVVWGVLVLGEEKVKQRLIATSIMIAGVLCITLGA